MPQEETHEAEQIGVRVLLFSVLRERVGAGEIAMSLSAPATGSLLLDQLFGRFPTLSGFRSVVRLAVNERFASADSLLSDGDEVALLTPMSGG